MSSDDSLEHVREVCAAAGLRLRGAELAGGLLKLFPERGGDLPPAEVLGGLTTELRGDGIRWVTLVIEDDE